MRKRIITDPKNYPIQPQHIDIQQNFWDFEDTFEGISASWIVSLCQKLGSWDPFTKQQLELFYNEGGHKNFRFYGLDSDGFIVIDGEQCRVTHEFVCRCFTSAPVVSSVAPRMSS